MVNPGLVRFGVSLLLCLAVFHGRADTHYVSRLGSHVSPYTNWVTAATNIQSAVDASSGGDTVLVTNGWYSTGAVNDYPIGTLASSRVAIYKPVSMRSVNGPQHTFIVGSLSYSSPVRGAYMTNGASLTGFTVSSGRAKGVGNDEGGGIWCELEGEAPVIADCIVTGCWGQIGGGVYGGTVDDSILVDNSANIGGGAYKSLLRNCRVVRNRAGNSSFPMGGGVSDSRLIGCFVCENDSRGLGGGACNSSLSNCTVVANGPTGTSGCINENCIVWGNILGDTSPHDVNRFTCSPGLSGFGNITNDPQLTPSYRLRSTSPCIDAGTASNAPATDIDGEVRWDHPGHSNVVSTVDIGADEFVDIDLDHMADYWETERFGGTTNSSGTADDDNDELTDLGEYENDTDPGNADTDVDSMPDGWEVGNALDPLADDGDADPDSDTMHNRGEYTADTDPRNPDSVLEVTDVAAELGGIRIDWKGGRQAWQFLECRPDLTTGAPWTPILAVPPPTPLTNAIIDLGATNRTLFYRIRAER
jgi:hypothetical protein